MSAPASFVPPSILDTDLYKLTMQQAVLHHFPNANATYSFTNRDKDCLFTPQCIEQFRNSVAQFTNIALTPAEHSWLHTQYPFFTDSYLDYLLAYRFKPEQVSITYTPTAPHGAAGTIEIAVTGPWIESIMWEVPLMATLSQCYFETVNTDWNYQGQDQLAYNKACTLLDAGCTFSEFGTRRRRSYESQVIVLNALICAARDQPDARGKLAGTSNAHLAHKYGLTAIGTIAHEWFMGVAALKGYEHTHLIAMDLWEQVYSNERQRTALTDTFTTDAFFQDLMSDPDRARRWGALRQDSGDPFKLGVRAKEFYEKLGVDARSKVILHSDALTVNKAVKLQAQADALGYTAAYGIGTSFTNDFGTASSEGKETSKALNIVIKLKELNGEPCVKLSDDLTKTTGDPETVKHIKEVYGLVI